MKRTQLHDNWTMQASGGSVPDAVAHRTIPAAVPGCAHTDLMSAGLMPDPYLDMVEDEVVWAHRANWTYERPIDIARAAPDERVDLVFEGLDTVATVRLGDTELGRTRNQHRTYRFDVRDHAGAGDATLQVAFASALIHAEEEESRVGARPRVYPTPMNMVRKMACSF
ncbi:MAG: glycoside hydrolase family 2 protein, partial [Actinomycetota bacterium]|nr:glycoside hydrolase family 2 protein [Actinomycetota bacterium]